MKKDPFVAQYMPPVTGSIYWCRLILNTVKASILRFTNAQPDILEEEEGKLVKTRYVALAHALRNYERSRHNIWMNEAQIATTLRLSQSILLKCHLQIPFNQYFRTISGMNVLSQLYYLLVLERQPVTFIDASPLSTRVEPEVELKYN
ncbi:unnamed protein product [Protopolystoma xenopodis]|uniref:Dynein heavy chain tail domain-containing protein n=1 Tax=Protopolystoma xenopodis TaxID=117903 RepID=A0A3S5AQN9_9PLAT|nr:unnamed protein product [Protopolystoma xenopodis]